MEKVTGALLSELRNAYLFKDFTNEELDAIIHLTDRKTVEQGRSLFSGNNECFYFVHYGSLRTQLAGPHGQMTSLNLIGSGGIVGAIGAFTDLPRLVETEAMETTEVYVFNWKNLEGYFDGHPKTAAKFYRSLGHHLARSLQNTIQELAEVRETRYLEKHGLSSL